MGGRLPLQPTELISSSYSTELRGLYTTLDQKNKHWNLLKWKFQRKKSRCAPPQNLNSQRILYWVRWDINSTNTFSKRMTSKFQPDGWEFKRIKLESTRESDAIAYVDSISTFGVKFGIEKVGGNWTGVAVSNLRNLNFHKGRKSEASRWRRCSKQWKLEWRPWMLEKWIEEKSWKSYQDN